jgi:hypothetical protein
LIRPSGDTKFGNTGPADQGGRTAFTFDANDGDLMTPGAIIVSINYENGGTKPEVQIRVWMHQSDFNTLNSNRPFNVVAGSFETGEGTLIGYAKITQ